MTSSTINIPDTHTGQRLDKALGGLCEDVSRSDIQKLITQGQVFLNGQVAQSVKVKVKTGDQVVLPALEQNDHIDAQEISIDIVYEDEDLAVINKQPGLTVHPGAGQKDRTLVNALLHIYGDDLRHIGEAERPGIVHRLDKDTSGLMLVARSKKAYKSITSQLANHDVRRIYHALVWGVPNLVKDTINRPIARNKNNRQKMHINEEGREAITDYLMIENYGEALSLLECSLHTGRTHQIRVHCQSMGHPVIGDRLYGEQPTKAQSYARRSEISEPLTHALIDFPRQALHAYHIEFMHPSSEEMMRFSADYPDDLSIIINSLRAIQ